ncbi:MAG: hypothetical protein AAB601_00935, partial [Patescibacteria group bacterium]
YSKEEYFKTIKQWDLGSYRTYRLIQEQAEARWKKFVPKPTMDEFTVGCSGSHIFQSKNCKQCFEIVGAEDCKFMAMMNQPPIKDCYDITYWGTNLTGSYEGCVVGENCAAMKFGWESGINTYATEYSKLSTSSKHHFGCVSVRKNDFCILNKRYSEGEFQALRERVRKHMADMPYTDERGMVYRYGEFFPPAVSPFAYNETLANEFFPLTKEQTLESGYRWREIDRKEYDTTMSARDLPDHIRDAAETITGEVIGCARCGRGYQIIDPELQFLRAMNLPLPRECPFCRVGDKLKQWVRNLRVFERECARCATHFETNYPVDEVPEILCKKCYQAEMV